MDKKINLVLLRRRKTLKYINNRGQISVYTMMMVLVILILIFGVLELVSYKMGQAKSSLASEMAADSVMAQYNKELFNRYHLNYLDISFQGLGQSYGEAMCKETMERTLMPKSKLMNHQNPLYSFKVNDVCFSDAKTILEPSRESLKDQITDYMKYRSVEMAIYEIADYVEGKKGKDETYEVGFVEDEYKPISVDRDSEGASEEQSEGNASVDLDAILMSTTHVNMSVLVKPKDMKISNATFDRSKLSSYRTIGDSFSNENWEFCEEDIKNLVTKWTDFKSYGQSLRDKVYLLGYVKTCFSNAIEEKSKDPHRLKYEMEYLVAGFNSDRENFDVVVYEITGIRFALNMISILEDEEKCKEAEAIAEVISIVTFTEEFAEGEKYIVLALWSYLEGLVDMRTMLNGDKVPVYKTSSEWMVDIRNIGNWENLSSNCEYGLGYEDYLLLLIAIQPIENQNYDRMLHLMEMNLMISENSFQMKNMVYELCVLSTVELKKRFMPRVGGSSGDRYQFRAEQRVAY